MAESPPNGVAGAQPGNTPPQNYDLHQRVERDFAFHPATETTGPKHDAIRALFRSCAHELVERLPVGREQSMAFTKLDEAMFWSNAAIARPS